MDAKFQPTYMPKLPISAVPRPVINISVLYVVAVIMFVVVLGLVIGVYIYEHFLNQDIERLNGELVTARDSFELSTIAELKRTAAFTDIALGLLDRHIAVSNFFSYLQESTYINTAFSGLILTTDDSQATTVSLTGKSGSYNTTILQTEHLLKNAPFLSNPKFSNFALDEAGSVGYTFTASVDPRVVDYKKQLSSEQP